MCNVDLQSGNCKECCFHLGRFGSGEEVLRIKACFVVMEYYHILFVCWDFPHGGCGAGGWWLSPPARGLKKVQTVTLLLRICLTCGFCGEGKFCYLWGVLESCMTLHWPARYRSLVEYISYNYTSCTLQCLKMLVQCHMCVA